MSPKKRYYKGKKSGMMSGNSSNIANMPSEVIIREYPSTAVLQTAELDDTIRAIDNQIKDDSKHAKRGKFPESY